ncbi:hypothetical protein D3C81_1810500 [compost metagenome]
MLGDRLRRDLKQFRYFGLCQPDGAVLGFQLNGRATVLGRVEDDLTRHSQAFRMPERGESPFTTRSTPSPSL